jgi:hypothetical protein
LGLSAAVASAQPEMRIIYGLDVINAADVFDLGDVDLLAQEHVAFAIHNYGDASLEFVGVPRVEIVELSGGDAADFRGELNTPEVAPGGLALLDLWFTPSSRGDREIEITVRSNDPAFPDYTFKVWASGVAPLINVALDQVTIADGETLDIGELSIDEVLEVALAIENLGNAPLMLAGEPEHVEFREFSDGSSEDFQAILPAILIGPGASAPLLIVLDPSSSGKRVVELVIPSNDPEHAQYTIRLEALVHEAEGEDADCNGNAVADSIDVASHESEDCDGDGVPDECQPDADADGVIDACDLCPGFDDGINTDSDAVPDCLDNCPSIANHGQEDQDGDGLGDACDDDPSTPNIDPPGGGDGDGGGGDGDGGGNSGGDQDPPQGGDGDDDQSPGGGNRGLFGFCGAGGMGLLPLTMLGLLGMRYRRGR